LKKPDLLQCYIFIMVWSLDHICLGMSFNSCVDALLKKWKNKKDPTLN
jgi:hypothetical protein